MAIEKCFPIIAFFYLLLLIKAFIFAGTEIKGSIKKVELTLRVKMF